MVRHDFPGGVTRIAMALCALAVFVLGAPAMAQTVTPIATIQANPLSFDGQVVTIEGQIYIPANYRRPTGDFAGYIQDSSGRGLQLFREGVDNPLLFDVGNIVRVTGTVDVFFSTTEVRMLTSVVLLSSGNPPLQPVRSSTAAANSAAWEGTFIEVTGTITNSVPTPTSNPPALNYTVNDGSGATIVRVVNTLPVGPFTIGQRITGRGAGSEFQGSFQLLVGRTVDVFVAAVDTLPPALARVSAPRANEVMVEFNKPVTAATAEAEGNYEVFEASAPSNTIAVANAILGAGGQSVTLTLASSLVSGVTYSLRVNNVQDSAGNTIAANSTQAFTFTQIGLHGPPFTFVPAIGETYPIEVTVSPDIAAKSEILLRVFDLQGRLRRTLADTRNNSPVQPVVRWNGRDNATDLVPAGTYVVHLVVTNVTTGGRDTLQMPVVVASRLNR